MYFDLFKTGIEITSTPASWCEKSLVPIGLVAEEVIDEGNNSYGYAITEYGNNEGKSFAGLLLNYSLKHPDISLRDLFGETVSTADIQVVNDIEFKNRAPNARHQILMAIVKSALPVRIADLQMKLENSDEKNSVTVHLQKLAKAGIIIYQSPPARQPYVYYKFNSETAHQTPPKNNKFIGLTNKVYSIMQQYTNQIFTSHEVSGLLYGSEDIHNRNKRVGKVLQFLVREGYVLYQNYTPEQRSVIDMSLDKLEQILELLSLLESFQNGDPAIIQEGLRLSASINARSHEIAVLMKKAEQHSPYVDKVSKNISIERIRNFIQNNPGLKTIEIQTLLLSEYQQELSLQRINDLLREMRKYNQVTSIQDKGAFHWIIV